MAETLSNHETWAFGKWRDGAGRAALLVLILFGAQIAAHLRLISLPFFWDEAGYYVPAAHDYFTRGFLIPETIPSNAHPPLLSLYISAWWRIFGESVAIARIAMLAISAIGLWAVFRLGRVLHCARTGLLALICTALYPCYFAQSSMVLPDLPSAAFTLLGLSYYFENRGRAALFFCIAVLFKETAVIAPLSLLLADTVLRNVTLRKHVLWTAAQVALLTAWYAYHWAATSFVFGNAEFFRYNVAVNVSLSRFLLALPIRVWQAFGHLGMMLPTVAACVSLAWPGGNRARLSLPAQDWFRLGAIVFVHLIALSILGGALLTRYLLPIVPLIVLMALLIVQRKVLLTIAAAVWFLMNLNVELPYHHPAEENLAYRDFVLAHKAAADFLQGELPTARVATAWSATFELTMPFLGYVSRPLPVVAVERVDYESLRRLNDEGRKFDFVLTFNREYHPPDSWLRPRRLLGRLAFWRKTDDLFGTPPMGTPDDLAQALQADVVRAWKHGPFQVALLRPRSAEREQMGPKPTDGIGALVR